MTFGEGKSLPQRDSPPVFRCGKALVTLALTGKGVETLLS